MAQILLAELMTLADALSARQLLSRWQAGALEPLLRLLMDAKSVFDIVTWLDFRTPSEESLSVPVRAVRDDLADGKPWQGQCNCVVGHAHDACRCIDEGYS
eukprot:124640-Amphidinium_carterae.1